MAANPLPWFFVLDGQPVKMEETEDGGLAVLVLDWDTGELVPDLDFLAPCLEPGRDVVRPTEAEFDAYLEALRAALEDRRRRQATEPEPAGRRGAEP
jgi:hypothetical protein